MSLGIGGCANQPRNMPIVLLEKDFFGNPIKPFSALSKKANTASANELEENTRSRSAKLRIAERNPNN
jgi:16S rRNA (cytosine1402-N4)-methyltransferase